MKNCLVCEAPLEPGRRKFCCQQHAMKWHNDRQVWANRPDRELHNQRRKANPEAHAARLRKWRAENPDAQKAIARRYRENHREEVRARHSKWAAQNPDLVVENGRRYHAENREKANAGRRARREANLEQETANQRSSNQKTRIVSPWVHLLASARERAKKRHLPFDLTEDWAMTRWTGDCELTQIPFRLGERGSGPKVFSPSIDQIIAKKGYTQDNCRFVLWAINALKHDGTDEEMYLVAAALMDVKFSNDFNGLKRTSTEVITPKTAN